MTEATCTQLTQPTQLQHILAHQAAAHAQRAFDTLTSAGADAVIETADQNGATVYRVMVQAANDENKAYALREMVAGYGFFDARVIRPN